MDWTYCLNSGCSLFLTDILYAPWVWWRLHKQRAGCTDSWLSVKTDASERMGQRTLKIQSSPCRLAKPIRHWTEPNSKNQEPRVGVKPFPRTPAQISLYTVTAIDLIILDGRTQINAILYWKSLPHNPIVEKTFEVRVPKRLTVKTGNASFHCFVCCVIFLARIKL